MDTFFDNLIDQFDNGATAGVADSLGIPIETITSAFASAVPAVMTALAGKAAQPEGATALMKTFNILTSAGSSSPATSLSGMLNDPRAMNAAANMAKSLFGDSLAKTGEGLAAQTGLSAETGGKVLIMATPSVMGAVGTLVKYKGLDAAGLASFLSDETKAIAAMQPAAIDKPPAPEMMAEPAEAAGVITSNAGEPDLNMDPAAAAALASKTGLPEGTVQHLAPVIVGFVLTALGRKAKQPDGLKQIGALIDRAGEAGITSMSAADYVKQADPAKNAEVLGALIGGNTFENVADNFGRKMGITPEQAAGLLGVGVPVVLGQLGKVQKSLGTDTAGLAAFITEKANTLQQSGDLNYILDDVPGIGDNVKRSLKKLFGRS